jgi:DNA-binding transcriptional regulator YiaG
MKSSFVEQLGPRARLRAVDRVSKGSRERLSLRPLPDFSDTVAVARALARRGVSLSAARRVVDRLAAGHAAPVVVPMVEGPAFAEELRRSKVEAGAIAGVDGQSIASVRKRLKLSQEQFANAFNMELGSLRNWEQGRTSLDPQTVLVIKMIERFPDLVEDVAADFPPEVVRVRAGKRA